MTRRGSTRQWRRVRAFVLERDRYRCQVPKPPAGIPCGAPAPLRGRPGMPAGEAGHIVADAFGGTDHPDNLRAECSSCSSAGGAQIKQLLTTTRKA